MDPNYLSLLANACSLQRTNLSTGFTAPWLTDRLRQRIRDFVTVLRCRFPTVQDTRTPRWGKASLRTLARWRYSLRRYDRPWELDASQRLLKLLDPRVTSI